MSKMQIKISTGTDVPPRLHPGELAYSYKSGKLFIGPPGKYNSPPAANLIELLDTNEELITQNINQGDTSQSPSGDAIYNALQNITSSSTVDVEYNSTVQEDVEILSIDSDTLNVIPDQNDSSKILIAAKPYWGSIDLDNNTDVISPNKYENLKFKSGQGIVLSVDINKIQISTNINDNNTNGDPNELWSSERVRQAILATAGVSPSADNDFTGINTFPDIDIMNATPTNKQVVNTGSVKTYIGSIATQIVEGLSIIKYVFDSPSQNWMIVHNKGTRVFDKTILDDQDNEMLAGIDIIDDNSFIIELTEDMTGSVLVRF